MENTKDLLTLVLEQHYKKSPKILQDALLAIQQYTDDKKTREKYETILKSLYELLQDLPKNILLYFLTTVPLPEEPVNRKSSALFDLMKKTNISLPNNIRPVLLDYLNSNIPSSCSDLSPVKSTGFTSKPAETVSVSQEKPVQTTKRFKGRKREPSPVIIAEDCKRLDDLCADYVYRNLNFLNSFYKRKLNKLMQLKANHRQKHQNVLKDTNRKIKLLRMIYNGDVTYNFLKDEYEKKDVLDVSSAEKTVTLFEENLSLGSTLKNALDVLYDKL